MTQELTAFTMLLVFILNVGHWVIVEECFSRGNLLTCYLLNLNLSGTKSMAA